MSNIKKFKEIVLELKKQNYQYSVDWNNTLTNPTVFLRHDIDFCLTSAHKIALKEIELGVFSTFFIMLTSNMYNTLSKNNMSLIKDIKDMGHKISLHFDPSIYQNLNGFNEEKKVFQDIFQVNVDIVSIHKPGSFLENNNNKIFGVSQTYQDRYFKEMVYISDSGGKNPFPQIQNYLGNSNKKNLQLLIHPIWWTQDEDQPTSILNKWRYSHFNYLTEEIGKNCKTFIKDKI